MNENDDIESIQRIITERNIKQESEQFMKDFREHPFLPIFKRVEKLQDLTAGWYLNPTVLKLFADSGTLPYINRLALEVDSIKNDIKFLIFHFEQEKEKRKSKDEPIFPNAKLVEDEIEQENDRKDTSH